MSKINEQLLYEQDVQMEYYYKFMDHIYDVLNPEPRLDENDIDDMEMSYWHNPKPVNKINDASVPQCRTNITETIKDVA